MDLKTIFSNGKIAYDTWVDATNALMKKVQQDTAEYIELYGEQLPDDLNPIDNMIDLFQSREETLKQSILLATKAQIISQWVQDAQPTPDPDPPLPDPDLLAHPGGTITVPNGQSPLKYLIEAAQAKYSNPRKRDIIPIYLPAGYIDGVEIGGTGSTPLDRVQPWWGNATLILFGHPDGTRVKPVHNNDGWGSSIVISPNTQDGTSWAGYVEFHDLEMEASGANVLQLGLYGSQIKKPLKGLYFKRCSFLDHPLASVTTTRPISANQCSLTFIECLWDLPVSQEHAVYSRNPYGDSVMDNCKVTAVGGQIWQEAGRPSEGPFWGYPSGKTTIKNSEFCCYHKDPGRAGSAITFAGSARDYDVINNILKDLDESDDVYGAFVAWDGGKHYSIFGKDMTNIAGNQKKGQYANGVLRIEGNTFVQRNPNRAVLKINSCAEAIVQFNGIWGSKPCDVADHDDAGVGKLAWQDNNRAIDRQRAIDAGIALSDLVESDLRINKKIVGKVSETFSVNSA